VPAARASTAPGSPSVVFGPCIGHVGAPRLALVLIAIVEAKKPAEAQKINRCSRMRLDNCRHGRRCSASSRANGGPDIEKFREDFDAATKRQADCLRSCAPAAPDPSSKASTLHRSSRPSLFDGLSIRCYPSPR
jgi:hypothetical protein